MRAEGESPDRVFWPGLEGLRGIAILMVFAFHLPWGAFRAGSYGVTIFFVLSGFLITTILTRELDSKGRIDFRYFYERRARRLLPALVGVVAGYLVLLAVVLKGPELWWPSAWPVLAYVSNYATILGRDLGHLTHTWSLAVEEHFYLLWPALLVWIPRQHRWRTVLGATALFTLWRGAIALGASSDARVEFGTDANAFALLIGATLAIGRVEGRIGRGSRIGTALALAALIGIANLRIHFTHPSFRWGVIPVAALSAIAIAGATSEIIPWLELRPLRWLGRISYGLYLWHFVLISLPWETWPFRPLLWQIVVPLLVAGLSWRFIERPWLRKQSSRPALISAALPARSSANRR